MNAERKQGEDLGRKQGIWKEKPMWGPRNVVGLACLRNSKKVIMTEAERRRESGGDTVSKEGKCQT